MELLGNHLQVFLSVILILGAALVAILFDLLKRNNEHLREQNVELRAHREMLMAQPILAGPSGFASPQFIPAPRAEQQPKGARRSALSQPAESPAPVTGGTLSEARLLAREIMQRGTQQEAQAPARLAAEQDNTTRQPEVIGKQTSPAPRRNWETLLNSARPRCAEQRVIEVIINPAAIAALGSGEISTGELAIPPGFQEGMLLARLLDNGEPVRGLVLLIAINGLDARRGNSGELGAAALVASVTEHIRSILRPRDFACQSSNDEFLIICPGDRDGAARRRLSRIAESLWEFQLRTVGASAILFSWAGMEAGNEPLAAVLAELSERTRETRRGRRSLAIEAPRRIAV